MLLRLAGLSLRYWAVERADSGLGSARWACWRMGRGCIAGGFDTVPQSINEGC